MAGKKYKPALYELVGKGRVKPDDRGALVTPKWFYGEGEQQIETEPVRQEPKVIIHRGPQVPPPEVQEESKEADETLEAQTEKDYGLHLGKNIRIWAPWWVVGLTVLGLVLGFLVTYRIGQATGDQAKPTSSNAGLTPSGSPGDTGPSEELKKIRNGSVRQGILNLPKPKPTTLSTETGGQNQGRPARTVTIGSLCLILCGSDKRRDLIDVQEYFTKKGILTRIGRLENRYVLYTAQGVDSRTGSQASQLKNRVATLGDGYNQEKPRTATSFPGSTFKTAYWVKRTAITRLD